MGTKFNMIGLFVGKLVNKEPSGPCHLRIYITKGQFNKLDKK